MPKFIDKKVSDLVGSNRNGENQMDNNLTISSQSIVDLILHLKWKSGDAVHTDSLQASGVNIWRDVIPPKLMEALNDREAGEQLKVSLSEGEAVESFAEEKVLDIERTRFDRNSSEDTMLEPQLGRFYPKGVLRNFPGTFKDSIQPFRCVGLKNGRLTADFNHPLAGKEIELSVVIGKVKQKTAERGGTSHDWMEILTNGPGMQARWKRQQTDFFSADAFKRDDQQSDVKFYRKPRFVHHIDETARDVVKNTYGRFLSEGMNVLDLMSSWESHIPTRVKLGGMVGLGLNEEELRSNQHLTDFRVHDLNSDAALPFDSNTFDVVINTASIEYLIDPLPVFNEIYRILRPEGCYIVTFSNRWFPTKAIRIWQELHEHERMGLVLEYFLRSGGYKDLQTYSIRGLPRPRNDKYYPQLLHSDPVYAVWGRK